MIETIYIEENIVQHPRVIEIMTRFPQARKIICGRYGEVVLSLLVPVGSVWYKLRADVVCRLLVQHRLLKV